MYTFAAPDGTQLAYHRSADGDPLVCLPGGPMQASVYLDDLGGLSAHRALVRLDLRGTGESAAPADQATYRCDRQVGDVEALRAHLGLESIDLLGHSAGATLAILYATRYPRRVRRLALLNPSPRPAGLVITDADRREVAELRRGEDWFPEAFAAFERIWAGHATAAEWGAIAPFHYGRWDGASRAAYERGPSQTNGDAAAAYYAAGAFDPATVRAALADLDAPVLLVAGEYDVGLPPARAAEFAGLMPRAELVVAPGGGHFPWLDDPQWLVAALAAFAR
ncbi:alpha/beta fold hydrolase [Phytohabitans houttuyneae]|uniref:Hydrolase n=1 Tax=Phytohabitans houttuyneae TaxID=1076126 RepID=A0A6V8KQL1_9ACTN|nr:alpha/beta hydrolase [Phytohabitans houttuyneae]GFJ82895.1 hydrolase [Phytohabitans houttuyneae]